MTAKGYTFRALVPADYDRVRALWERSAGIGLNESDTREAINAFLARNPGLSLVALAADGSLAGAVLSGHDGRRGYLHHLAVDTAHRRRGLGSALVERCLKDLRALGIPKCNIYLFADNADGRAFWLREGWAVRDDLVVLQRGSCGC
jgi:putative acetyltransferase